MQIMRSIKSIVKFFYDHTQVAQLFFSCLFFIMLILFWYIACYRLIAIFINNYKRQIQALNIKKKNCLQAHFDKEYFTQELKSLPKLEKAPGEIYSGLTGFMNCLSDNNLHLLSCVPEKNSFKVTFVGLFYHILAFFDCLSSTCCNITCKRYAISFDSEHVLHATCWIEALI